MSTAALNTARTTQAPADEALHEAGPFDAWLPDLAADARGAAWIERLRSEAADRARTQAQPTKKSEGWRYTGLQALMEQGFVRVPLSESPQTLRPGDIQGALLAGLDAHRVVMVDGHYAPELSALDALPAGVQVSGLRTALVESPDLLAGALGEVAGDGAHLFAAINTATMDDGMVLLIDRGVALDKPIELLHLSTGAGAPRVAQPRHLVRLADGAQATLIERYAGLGEAAYCNNALIELDLGRDAVLKHRRVQMESPSAFHISGVYLRQGASSRYDAVNIGLGGRWARTDIVTRFSGEHAECDLQGLYLAGDQQLIDYHLDVRHSLPRCNSRENFKGIVHGKGRAVFDGLVYVAKDAQQTDAAMSNRNLLLSQNAEIDTKPQLEIYADDVKCSHGTTVGQIEPEMLFYLRSRGIAEGLARRMLCLGFAGEIIGALGIEPLAEHIAEAVGDRLERAPL